jgi:hypothetical protein
MKTEALKTRSQGEEVMVSAKFDSENTVKQTRPLGEILVSRMNDPIWQLAEPLGPLQFSNGQLQNSACWERHQKGNTQRGHKPVSWLKFQANAAWKRHQCVCNTPASYGNERKRSFEIKSGQGDPSESELARILYLRGSVHVSSNDKSQRGAVRRRADEDPPMIPLEIVGLAIAAETRSTKLLLD